LLAAGIILIWPLIIRMDALWKNEGIIHLYLLVNIIDAPANGKKYFPIFLRESFNADIYFKNKLLSFIHC
jgi:hypothetical protein